MPNQNDDHAQALIDALAPKLLDALLPKIAQSVETQIDGLKKKNAELLDKLAETKKPDPLASIDKLLAKLDAEQREQAYRDAGFSRDAEGKLSLAGTQQGHVIDRQSARDPAKYREAKARAEAAGVTLRVVDNSDRDPTIRNTGRRGVTPTKVVTFDDSHERVRYVRADMMGGNGFVQRRLAAEREGYRVRAFHDPADLPPHARQKFALMEKAAQEGTSDADA
ncbi:hypothetical protein E2L08_12510 [Palleronia sediminis]|uniref:Uncharacterized protein n=1 Tax=Palleronia sediminis TaxID=2547833 RepID=A0A4R6A5J3_9RHOB|nr:hypothetical protein [Palleronia sediminis]TDL78115.1 hypothetical protein E2L08_12510 [Palleronia sediminis]